MKLRKTSSNLTWPLLALLLALAVATIQITPDPTDDVYGVVRPHKPLPERMVTLASVAFSTMFFMGHADWSRSPGLITPNLLQLLCTYRF